MEEDLLKTIPYDTGSDITLLNTIYIRKIVENNKYKDFLTLIIKNNITGKKENYEIESPKYTFYVIKEEYRLPEEHVPPIAFEKDKCEPITVHYSQIEKVLAEMTGNLDFFYENIRNGNSYANKLLHVTANYIMNSDMDIEDYYRYIFSKKYINDVFKINKSFLDIETDTRYAKGNFAELGEVPINAVTVINQSTNSVYTFLLRNKENPLIEEFEKSINENLFIELKQFVIEKVGGEQKAKKYKIMDLNYNFIFFDNEIELIYSVFENINTLCPDIVFAWNMRFDIPYIIERIKVLGYNPEDIMCHKDFKHKVCTYYTDERNTEIEERCDFAKISGYSVYLDQMIHFASRRKGQQKFDSYKLDAIGEYVAGVHKLDWSHITTSFAKFPYLDYKTFVFYNIMDVIVQVCIENKASDAEYVMNSSIINCVRFSKVHRQSVYLIDRYTAEWDKLGLVIGNNNNRFNKKPTEKFPGAIIQDPVRTNNYSKKIINGRPSNIVENLVDYDYKALYPNDIGENNISPNTQYGMIHLERDNYVDKYLYNTSLYSVQGRFLENLISQNIIVFCNRYFKLASYKELLEDLNEYYVYLNNMPNGVLDKYTPTGLLNAVTFKNIREPVSFINKELLSTVKFIDTHPNYNELIERIKRGN